MDRMVVATVREQKRRVPGETATFHEAAAARAAADAQSVIRQ
jgi:hypothetical protein